MGQRQCDGGLLCRTIQSQSDVLMRPGHRVTLQISPAQSSRHSNASYTGANMKLVYTPGESFALSNQSDSSFFRAR